MDIFMGSGTTAETAKRIGLNYFGIEANTSYMKINKERTAPFGQMLF